MPNKKVWIFLFLSDGRVNLMVGGAILAGFSIVFDFRVVRGGRRGGWTVGGPVGVTSEGRRLYFLLFKLLLIAWWSSQAHLLFAPPLSGIRNQFRLDSINIVYLFIFYCGSSFICNLKSRFLQIWFFYVSSAFLLWKLCVVCFRGFLWCITGEGVSFSQFRLCGSNVLLFSFYSLDY